MDDSSNSIYFRHFDLCARMSARKFCAKQMPKIWRKKIIAIKSKFVSIEEHEPNNLPAKMLKISQKTILWWDSVRSILLPLEHNPSRWLFVKSLGSAQFKIERKKTKCNFINKRNDEKNDLELLLLEIDKYFSLHLVLYEHHSRIVCSGWFHSVAVYNMKMVRHMLHGYQPITMNNWNIDYCPSHSVNQCHNTVTNPLVSNRSNFAGRDLRDNAL